MNKEYVAETRLTSSEEQNLPILSVELRYSSACIKVFAKLSNHEINLISLLAFAIHNRKKINKQFQLK